MTIHAGHPFADPDPERDPARRLRGRLGGAVSLWTTGAGPDRAGLTVSSLMVAHGEPARVMALLDPDAELVDALRTTGTAVVQLLSWEHRDLAEAFAGLAPAPGGVFRLGDLDGHRVGSAAGRYDGLGRGPAGGRARRRRAGRVLVTGVVEHVELGEETDPLVHRRGRYVRPSPPG